MKHVSRVLPLMVIVLLSVALGSAQLTQAQSSNPLADPVQILVPEVISERPHDDQAYTQGFLLHNGLLYESTGAQTFQSTLREVDPQTGEVLRSIDVPEEYYAEGLALVGDTLIQLTWKSEIAFVYDVETFEQIGTLEYTGEGWGLCSDGRYLYLSDGSPFIDVRDLETFELIFSGLVTVQGQPVDDINELECAGDYIYANVWHTDYILKIDKTNGVTVAVVDASALFPAEERAQYGSEAVLNGIAYDAEADTFLITGKYWPKVFEVKFVPQEQ